MPEYNVGPGIRDKMRELGDAPAADSHFHTVEIARGEKYDYYADNAMGEWRIRAEPAVAAIAPEPPTPPTPLPALVIVQKGSTNYTVGRGGQQPRAIVLHTMAGYLAGSDAWFNNPASEVSAHFGVGLDGRVHQYVALKDTAWANGRLETAHRWPWAAEGNPNRLTVSIETEDKNDAAQPVTDAQYRSVLALCQHIQRECPTVTHLVGHRVISPVTRPSCPGPRWVESGRIVQLAGALGLALIT